MISAKSTSQKPSKYLADSGSTTFGWMGSALEQLEAQRVGKYRQLEKCASLSYTSIYSGTSHNGPSKIPGAYERRVTAQWSVFLKVLLCFTFRKPLA